MKRLDDIYGVLKEIREMMKSQVQENKCETKKEKMEKQVSEFKEKIYRKKKESKYAKEKDEERDLGADRASSEDN